MIKNLVSYSRGVKCCKICENMIPTKMREIPAHAILHSDYVSDVRFKSVMCYRCLTSSTYRYPVLLSNYYKMLPSQQSFQFESIQWSFHSVLLGDYGDASLDMRNSLQVKPVFVSIRLFLNKISLYTRVCLLVL